jgi:hypothetical protein
VNLENGIDIDDRVRHEKKVREGVETWYDQQDENSCGNG